MRWNEATDNEAVYGYELYRSAGSGDFLHLASVKRNTHYDLSIAGGNTYRYYVVAYDLAGNRTEPSNSVEVTVPFPSERGEELHG